MTPAVLTGLALGDALGAPFEPSPEDPPDVNPARLKTWGGGMEAGHLGPAGTTTDDTGMATALAQGLAATPGPEFDLRTVAPEYLAWYRRERDRSGIGGTIRKALEAHERDGAMRGVPLPPGRVGNGTAMRAAPLGLRYWRSPQLLGRAACRDALFTHDSLEAEAGSCAVALAVAFETRISESGAHTHPLVRLVPMMRELTGAYRYTRMAWAVRLLSEYLGRNLNKTTSEAEAAYLREARDTGADGDVVHTVYTALLAASLPNLMPDPMNRDPDPVERARDQFRTGVRLAVQMGGDTDTRAAITGAILGARVRRQGLPPEWVGAMDPGQWAELERLDAALYEAAARGPLEPL